MWGDKGAAPPRAQAPSPCQTIEVMGKYLIKTFSTIRKTNGDTIRHEGFSKVAGEKVLELTKQVNKEVGYKYVGRFKDTHGNYYTQYARVSKELSNSECKVIYMVTITKLK